MDLEELLRRTPVRGWPASLMLRVSLPERLPAALVAADRWLSQRRDASEVLVITSTPPSPWHLSPSGGAVRFFLHEDPAAGKALELALHACRWPIVVLADESVSVTANEMASLLGLLNECDAVIGRRRPRGRWLARWLENAVRWVFAVPLDDPMCPVKVFRRDSIRGIPLQTRGALVDLELLAKLTFATSLVDQCNLTARGGGHLLDALRADRLGLWKLLLTPTFWTYDPSAPKFRPPPQDGPTSAPAWAAYPPAPAYTTPVAASTGPFLVHKSRATLPTSTSAIARSAFPRL